MNEDNVRENEMNPPEPADEAAAEAEPEITTDEADSAAEAETEAEHVETDSESTETEDVGSSSAETESPAEEANAMHAASPDAPEEPVETPVTFQDFNLTSSVMQAIDKMGFVEPTPIQKKSLPLVLEGRDLLGQAQTGTGKTAAFGIPMAQNLDPEGPVQALVLCPTRELAVQVSEELHELSLFSGQKVLPIYGGQRIDRQINALKKGVQIIAGTPGRVLDHLGRGTLDLTGLKMLILDEADMMLDMGFLP
ncbi:MAG TPA: DEAD/DEAH box helicase, partial [Thermoleophilia bacterium]|nr:DEAD/DEAH box helicase [Thermoleophilia bacterium]